MRRGLQRTSRRALVALLATFLVGGASLAVAVANTDAPVLGSKRFAPNGQGFGTVRPRRIFNGGDASGLIKRIHWRHWGRDVAATRGRSMDWVSVRSSSLGCCRGSRPLPDDLG